MSRSLTVWQNEAEALNNQLSLMLQNGFAGFALVFLVLALFLEMQQALSSLQDRLAPADEIFVGARRTEPCGNKATTGC